MSGRVCAKLFVGAGIVIGSGITLMVGAAEAAEAPRPQAPCSSTPGVGGLLGATRVCTVVDPVVQVLDPVLAPVTQAVAPVTAPVSGVVAKTGLSSGSQRVPSARASTAPASAVATVPPEPASGPFVPTNFELSGTPQVGVVNFAGAGLYDYSSLLGGAATFGELQYGDLFNGYAPEFGILGAQDDSAAARDVAAAGRAQALDTERTDRIALPILLAVLLLSAMTAAALRSWVHGSPPTTPTGPPQPAPHVG